MAAIFEDMPIKSRGSHLGTKATRSKQRLHERVKTDRVFSMQVRDADRVRKANCLFFLIFFVLYLLIVIAVRVAKHAQDPTRKIMPRACKTKKPTIGSFVCTGHVLINRLLMSLQE